MLTGQLAVTQPLQHLHCVDTLTAIDPNTHSNGILRIFQGANLLRQWYVPLPTPCLHPKHDTNPVNQPKKKKKQATNNRSQT